MFDVSAYLLTREQEQRGWRAEEDSDLVTLYLRGKPVLRFPALGATPVIIQAAVDGYDSGYQDGRAAREA
jgi:hypothetical protein